ncbi:hypothetical protein Pjdr2_0267 [Paenibacillus sp. JDR-2]|nr:hypothetical protein Pjdr2_0267 [Paenibacillus sp. JDR-2]
MLHIVQLSRGMNPNICRFGLGEQAMLDSNQ